MHLTNLFRIAQLKHKSQLIIGCQGQIERLVLQESLTVSMELELDGAANMY